MRKVEASTAWNIKVWLAWMAPPWLVVLAVGLAIAWLTDGQLTQEAYWSGQQDWFRELNRALSAAPHAVWSTFTLLGDGLVLLPLLSILIIPRPRLLVSILGAAPLATVFCLAGKALTDVPRPTTVLHEEDFTLIGSALGGYRSFPSGHAVVLTATTIAILAVLIPAPQSWRQWSLLLAGLSIAAMGCLARIAVGAHWPLDVLAGAAGGWIAGLCGAAVARRSNWHWESTGARRVVGAVLLVWSLLMTPRALMTASNGLVLWASALCGILAALWLLTTRQVGTLPQESPQ